MMNRSCALIVEGSPEKADRLENVLETLGFVSIICASAERAHHLVSSIEPNLIFLDLDEPPRNSLRLLAALRDTGLDAPVIWRTLSPNSESLERVRASGAQGALAKDSDAPTLTIGIRAVLCGDLYFTPQLTCPATPAAKAVAESQRLLKVLHQALEKQG